MPGERQRPHRPRATHPADSDPPRWFDNPRNVDRIVYALVALCALLVAVEPLIHRHGLFRAEGYWGFYGVYAFLGCILLVLAARLLRRLVMRPEDYYDR